MDTTENIKDFKVLSLALYGEDVIVSFRNKSYYFRKYGKDIMGKLVGRTWGEQLDHSGINQQTVIALTIKLENGEEEIIPCENIKSLSGFTPPPYNFDFQILTCYNIFSSKISA